MAGKRGELNESLRALLDIADKYGLDVDWSIDITRCDGFTPAPTAKIRPLE